VQINPYLHCNGQCEAAFKFYEKVLGAKIDGMFTFGDSPMAKEVPSDWQKKVMHARMTVNGNVLMGADASSERYQRPQGFSVSIGVKEPEEAERVFQRAGTKWHRANAHPENLLVRALRYAGRSVRYSLDGELRASGVTFRS
jgi:PhnB protein